LLFEPLVITSASYLLLHIRGHAQPDSLSFFIRHAAEENEPGSEGEEEEAGQAEAEDEDTGPSIVDDWVRPSFLSRKAPVILEIHPVSPEVVAHDAVDKAGQTEPNHVAVISDYLGSFELRCVLEEYDREDE